MPLTDPEVQRYSRQLLLPGFGPVSQEFLRTARVHVVGAGAIAGPALVYLAEAGVGTLAVDDGADVSAADASTWLHSPGHVGEPRTFVAMEALRGVNAFVRARAYATGFDATAALVCPESPAVAREAAERARKARLPHVVAQGDGDGGWVVSVPPGAACYACAQRGSAVLAPTPGAAASLGALAALELLLLLAQASQDPRGRRIELVRGQPLTRATVRQAGCVCSPPG